MVISHNNRANYKVQIGIGKEPTVLCKKAEAPAQSLYEAVRGRSLLGTVANACNWQREVAVRAQVVSNRRDFFASHRHRHAIRRKRDCSRSGATRVRRAGVRRATDVGKLFRPTDIFGRHTERVSEGSRYVLMDVELPFLSHSMLQITDDEMSAMVASLSILNPFA